ncbi:MAG TPA: sigma-54 dependent transcriptional regulator [Bacteroidota bacterium]|jgi:DNA-binding NtrC family response regulator
MKQKSKPEKDVRIASKILIVDDEDSSREMSSRVLNKLAVQIQEAVDGAAAINSLNKTSFDLVLLDLGLPRVSGMEVLEYVTSHARLTPVIILTGSNDVRNAVEAMKRGAYDYLKKPFNNDELLVVVRRALEFRSLKVSADIAGRSEGFSNASERMAGVSRAWLETLEKARRFAASDFLIFLYGETGSGKEVLARFIHENSARSDRPFVGVDCGIIPENLVESELFGHVKGAFTGADTTKEGLVELARGGTLFVDEIGHIDLKFQQKLLKFIETKTFRRVGDTAERTADVRIVTATNKNLPDEVEAGSFRADLWYRLNVMKLDIPPLRDRPGDVRAIAQLFLRKHSQKYPGKFFAVDALRTLESYPWPGNIRELQSAVQRGVVVSKADRIEAEDLGIDPARPPGRSARSSSGDSLLSMKEAEKLHLSNVLRATGWNITRAATVLKIGRTTLHAKLKEYGLKPQT